METFFRIFESLAAMLTIGCLGFWIISRRIVPRDALGLLSPLALDIALPSLIIANIISRFHPKEAPGWWILPLWWVGFTMLIAAMTAAFSLLSRKETRREFAMSLLFQNAIFFPLAIITSMFGADSPYTIDLFFFTLFHPALFFSTAPLFFSGCGPRLQWSKIFNRVLLATLAATAIPLLGLQEWVPPFLIQSLNMVGGMTISILMIILGGNIYLDFKGKGPLELSEVTKFVLVKNVLFPLIVLACLVKLQPGYNVALIALMQSAVPPITAVPVSIDRAGGNRTIANQFLVASFVFSLVSIPAVMFLFKAFFPAPQ